MPATRFPLPPEFQMDDAIVRAILSQPDDDSWPPAVFTEGRQKRRAQGEHPPRCAAQFDGGRFYQGFGLSGELS